MWLAECCSFMIDIKITSHIRIYTANTILKLKESKATDKPSSQEHAQTFQDIHGGPTHYGATSWHEHVQWLDQHGGLICPLWFWIIFWTQLSVDLWLWSLLLVIFSCVELEFRDKLDRKHRIRWRMWSLHKAYHHHFNTPLGLMVKYNDYISTKQRGSKSKE